MTHRLVIATLLVLAGIPGAVAREDAFGDIRPRPARPVHRIVRVAPPVLIRGYLPRNNAVPLYNEPPGFSGR